MAYRKEVNVNLLSYDSVSNACDIMQDALVHLLDLQPMLFLDLLARRIEDIIKPYYNGDSIAVTHTLDKSGSGETTVYKMAVSAKGNTVMFVEFGTGVPADSSQGLAKSSEFGAGSWSSWHMRTYQDWEESGKPMDKYPYNREGADAFLKVETMLPDLISQTAREVFGK